MPRIPTDEYLDCSVYLYPSKTDAMDGERAGGTGFLTGIPCGGADDRAHVYAVTNAHVIEGICGKKKPSPVVRMNTKEGGAEPIELAQSDWILHPDGDDLAICELDFQDDKFRYRLVPRDHYLTRETVDRYNIGPGDEVFLVGRFVNHEGRRQNMPSVRFGNVSMMPTERIFHRNDWREAFAVELRSIPGFSGSPVFVWIPPVSQRPGSEKFTQRLGPWLLGVNWGFINDGPPDRGNTGMGAVSPAWKLAELLDLPELITAREREDATLRAEPQ